jgi:hypothetical protein
MLVLGEVEPLCSEVVDVLCDEFREKKQAAKYCLFELL